MLLSRGAEANNKDKLGRTPLHLASTKGYAKVVLLLLQNGADILCKIEVLSKRPTDFHDVSEKEAGRIRLVS